MISLHHRLLKLGTLTLLVLVLSMTAGARGALAKPANGNQGTRPLTVMTQNLYFGYDIAPIFAATNPTSFIEAVTNAWASIQQTDFPARAQSIAKEVKEAKPDVIGLQEVALYRTGDTLSPAPTGVAYDFLQILLDALSADGMHYEVASTATNFDTEAPTATGVIVRDTDREVLLVREGEKDLSISNPQFGNYPTTLIAPTAVGTITIPRGWVSADVTVGGHTFRIISTHLESITPAFNEAQSAELLAGPAATPLPTILIGDYNSSASGTGSEVSATYGNLIAAGFADVWSETHPANKPGFTCCEQGDLMNAQPTLNERIDLVLTRGPFQAVSSRVIGDRMVDKTASGLWPSDHAGVIATIIPR